jgi:uncharacterized protein
MPITVGKRAVDFALMRHESRLGLSFFGGEPLLRFDFLKQMVSYCCARVESLGSRAPALEITLNTNGVLLTEEVATWLESVPSPSVALSLDGTAECHDRHRRDACGSGSYAAARTAAERLARREIPTDIVCVVRPDTAAALGNGLRSLLELDASSISLVPDLSAKWDVEGYAALCGGLRNAAEAWAEALRAGKSSRVEPFVSKILTYVNGGIPCPARCRLGGHEVVVAPSGRLYPCAQLVQEDIDWRWSIGDVEMGLDVAKTERLQLAKDRVEQTCAPCALRDRCQSHCGCSHVALTGELGVITDTLCETEAIAIEVSDRIAEVLWAERCPSYLELVYRHPWQVADGGVLTKLRRSRDDDAAR